MARPLSVTTGKGWSVWLPVRIFRLISIRWNWLIMDWIISSDTILLKNLLFF